MVLFYSVYVCIMGKSKGEIMLKSMNTNLGHVRRETEDGNENK